jgi:hypothetical protein
MAPSSLAVFFEPATAVLFLGLALANFGVDLLISAII